MPYVTPLHEVHEALGASFTDFAGWSMPLRYRSELAEHRAVRSAAGLFDLTHMGEIEVSGPDAAAALDHSVSACEACDEIESTKSVSDIYAPVDGEVVEVNDAVREGPEGINTDPYGAGWLFRVRVAREPDLLEAESYAAFVASTD